MAYIWTHILYDHDSRPTALDLACPNCGERIRFSKPSENGRIISGDCSGTWHLDDWEGTCIKCIRKLSGLSYEELPNLYYYDENSGIWAWNKDHLQHMIKVFSGEKVDSLYSFYDTYFRKDWLKSKGKFLKILKKMNSLK